MTASQDAPDFLDWNREFSRLDNESRKIRRAETDLAQAQTALAEAQVAVTEAESKLKTTKLPVDAFVRRNLRLRTIRVVRGRSLACGETMLLDMPPLFVPDSTDLSGSAYRVVNWGPLSQVTSIGRDGFGLILEGTFRYYLIDPEECALEVGG